MWSEPGDVRRRQRDGVRLALIRGVDAGVEDAVLEPERVPLGLDLGGLVALS